MGRPWVAAQAYTAHAAAALQRLAAAAGQGTPDCMLIVYRCTRVLTVCS